MAGQIVYELIYFFKFNQYINKKLFNFCKSKQNAYVSHFMMLKIEAKTVLLVYYIYWYNFIEISSISFFGS